MQGETIVTVTGNLTADPQIRFTEKGTAVARFRVASTPRVYDRTTERWTDGETLYITCTVWRQVAEHVCESLQRGMQIIVRGRLRQRTYTDSEGIQRTSFDIDADEVGLSLRHRIAYTDRTIPVALNRPPAPVAARTGPLPAHETPRPEHPSRPQRRGGWARIH